MPFLAAPKKFYSLLKTQNVQIQSYGAVGRWQSLQKFGTPNPNFLFYLAVFAEGGGSTSVGCFFSWLLQLEELHFALKTVLE